MQKQPVTKADEKILVVARKKLFPASAPQGLTPFDEQKLHHLITSSCEFQWRSKVETDPSFKQIIPYLIFSYDGDLFLMQRSSKTTEQRLKNLYSLGIGGHIREKDLSTPSILTWADREFHEEINYAGAYTPQFLGLLNDESNPVGQVHTGCVFLLNGASPHISIKSELASGVLTSPKDCLAVRSQLEPWSQIVLDHLLLN